MSLTSDKRLLQRQVSQLNNTDDDAKAFNTELLRLIEAISDDIQSDRTESLLNAVEAVMDKPVQMMNDRSINGAISDIQLEIRRIEAAIEAQRAAARALAEAQKKLKV